MEEWALIPEYEDYMISTEGKVKSLKKKEEHILSKIVGSKKGKLNKVKLYKNGKYKTVNVSTIMGIVFLGRKEGQMTKHIGDILDDRLSNLYIHDIEA